MLMKCPECSNPVSDKAETCPHCGYPIGELLKQRRLFCYDPETMMGVTPEDQRSIDIAMELYGDLLASGDGRVWNDGGQVVGNMKYKD